MVDATMGSWAPRTRINRRVVLAALIFVAIAIASVVAVLRFVEAERARDLQNWQTRLGIVADAQAALITQWVDDQIATLAGMAENASLQIYLSELSGSGLAGAVDPAELAYLRNYIEAVAKRSGYAPPVASFEIAANVERVGAAGLALTDAAGAIVVATSSMPPMNASLDEAMATARSGKVGIVDLYLAPNQLPTIGFVVPVYGVQEDSGTSAVIGMVVGLKPAGAGLYDRLRQPGETLRTAETYLVRERDGTIEYLSPLADGGRALERSLALDTPDLAAALAIDMPGGFGSRRDYAGREVLATGRTIPIVDWGLVRAVSAAEAMTEIDLRANTLLAVLLGALVAVAIALVAVWRHGASIRSAESAERNRQLAEQLESVTGFLRVVTDTLPDPLIAVDETGRYQFANMSAGREVGMHPRDMIGKLLTDVLGTARAERILHVNRQVLSDERNRTDFAEFDAGNGPRMMHRVHVRYPDTHPRPGGVLVLFDDITDLARARERRERTLRQLIDTLVAMIDRRDPNAAGQSARVAMVARAIAEEMHLSEMEVETAEYAGSLVNIAKLFLPVELLTKQHNLTPQEKARLDSLTDEAVASLNDIEFDGPVIEAIRQVKENWNGTGPRGLEGEAIEICARIVAVANTFVAMISPRAYRQPLGPDEVCGLLLAEAGTRYDRRPVSALVNLLDNRGLRERWSHLEERQGLEN